MSIQLSPDVEAGLRSEAAARGISVDTLLVSALDSYLAKTPALRGGGLVPYNERRAEMAWSEKPLPQYRGKWVVLEGDAVVASGPNPSEIYEQARSIGISSPFLIYVPSEEQEPFAGGWLD